VASPRRNPWTYHPRTERRENLPILNPVEWVRSAKVRAAEALLLWRKQLKIARVLVVAGASLDVRDGQRKSAADELVAEGRQAELDELRRLPLNGTARPRWTHRRLARETDCAR